MRLPRGFADDVKNQGDIVRVVSDYVSLKKRGANYLACCPFHSEKTPSFTVHAGKGLFKCFGCQSEVFFGQRQLTTGDGRIAV